ncbi:MAG: hypothetical protein R3F62_18085 [Planctomycetota bacterium]
MSSPEHDDALPTTEAAALAVAGALWAEDPVPTLAPSARDAFLAALGSESAPRVEASDGDAPGGAELEVRLRCTYCHDRLELEGSVYCGQCLAPHHAECVEAHGACAAPGCAGTRFVRAEPAARPRPLRRAAWVAAGLLGLTAAAAALVSSGWQVGEAPATSQGTVTQAPAPAPRPRPAREDGRLHVLYVEGSPRWQYRYLKEVLIAEPALSLQLALLDLDPDLPPEAPTPGHTLFDHVPGDLADYDVVILGDVDPQDVSATWLAQLRREVEDYGLGLIVAAGSSHPRGAVLDALAPLLPVELGPTAIDGRWSLALTGEGAQVPALRLRATYSENTRIWRDLPQIAWHAGATGPAPGGEVWVEVQGREGNGAAPVLAARRAGAGQVVWLGFEEAWRWRAEVGDEYLARCFLTLLERVRAPQSRWAPEVEAERDAERLAQEQELTALFDRVADALAQGLPDPASTELRAAEERYDALLDEEPFADRLGRLQVELTLVRAAVPWRTRPATAEDLPELEALAAQLAVLPLEHASRALVGERLTQARALVDAANAFQSESGDAQLVREALQLLHGGSGFPDGEACRLAREAFAQASRDPGCTETDRDRIRLAVAEIEQRHRFLAEATRILDQARAERYANLESQLFLLAAWLPEGALRDRARKLQQRVQAELGRDPTLALERGLAVLRDAWSMDPLGRFASDEARQQFELVRANPAHTQRQVERIRAAVAASERDARFLYNAEKVYTQNREDLFPDLYVQLSFLVDWLPDGEQLQKADELKTRIEREGSDWDDFRDRR